MRRLLFLLSLSVTLYATSVTTGQYDIARTGANMSETLLTQSSVAKLRKNWQYKVTGYLWAQPLIIENVTISAVSKTVLIVATGTNQLYAFDATKPGVTFWHNDLGAPYAEGNAVFIDGNVGIMSTPVADTSTNVLYFTSCNSSGAWSLHAVNLADGTDYHAPTVISATASGVTFGSTGHLQRPALLLLNGLIVIAFGSYADIGGFDWGWEMAYDKTTLTQTAAMITIPVGTAQGALWMSGGGLSSDGTSIFGITGNGPCDAGDYGDSFIETSQALAVTDFMTPTDCATLSANDTDLGSGRAVVVGSYVMGGGKDARWWVLNKGALGSNQATGPGIAQVFSAGASEMSNGYVAANGVVYVATGVSGVLEPINSYNCPTTCTTTPAATTSKTYSMAALAYSSNGATANTGVLWVSETQGEADSIPSAGCLHALNADTLAELYTDCALGLIAKFTQPTVANGLVYMSTQSGYVQVYGFAGAIWSGVSFMKGASVLQ